MRYITYTLAFLTIMFLGACGDSSFNPINKPTSPRGETLFGLVEVTISGIGTQNMSASALPALPSTAADLEGPVTGGPGAGTIQIEPVSVGSFTVGEHPAGLGDNTGNGWRYVYATYKVRNAQADADDDPSNNPVYTNPRQNLTFLAVNTNATYGDTPIASLVDFDGNPLSNTSALASKIIPTGRVKRTPQDGVRAEIVDVLQVYTETNVQNFETTLLTNDPGSPVTDIFHYGFVTKSPNVTPGSREMPASPGSDQFDGLVTFAFKIPLQEQANKAPFEISIMFLPIDDDVTRITQAPEEQNPEGFAALKERVAELNPAKVTVLPGSIYPRITSVPTEYICSDVRVAGTAGSPITMFPAAPVIGSLTPTPNNASISSAQSFSVNFSTGSVSGVNASNFVVHSGQHGTQTGLSYTSGSSISTSGSSFSPGELVEVTLTSEMNLCRGSFVARYRVGVTTGNGSFTPPLTVDTDDEPTAVELGFVAGTSAMDMVVASSSPDDKGVIYAGNGSGSFTIAAGTAVHNNPSSVTGGDFDNDGDLDVVSTNESSDDLTLIINNGSTISANNIPAGDLPEDAAAGDLNGDGYLDLVVANKNSDTITVLFNDGSDNFSAVNTLSTGNEPVAIALGDFNNDGALDLAVALYGPNDVTVFKGLGRYGIFTSPIDISVGSDPTALALADLDNDENLDIAVANSGDNNVSILLGGGDFTFIASSASAGISPIALALGDFEIGDGLDIAVVNENQGVSLIHNDGSGSFGPPLPPATITISVGTNPVALAVGDINGDGSVDIAVANSGDGTDANPGSVSILLNQL